MYFGVIVQYQKIIDNEQSSFVGENITDNITMFYTSHKQNISNLNEESDFSSHLMELKIELKNKNFKKVDSSYLKFHLLR